MQPKHFEEELMSTCGKGNDVIIRGRQKSLMYLTHSRVPKGPFSAILPRSRVDHLPGTEEANSHQNEVMFTHEFPHCAEDGF